MPGAWTPARSARPYYSASSVPSRAHSGRCPLITSQQLRRFYEQFRDQEVSFTRPVVQVLGLLTREVHLKCQGEIIPCVIFSSSMSEAKVVTSLRAENVARLRQAKDLVSLRFCLAQKAFAHTAEYDRAIADYLGRQGAAGVSGCYRYQ